MLRKLVQIIVDQFPRIFKVACAVWVVSPDKTLRQHLFDLVSTGGDSTSTNMRDYFDNFANVLRQYARLFRQFKR
jgi:hypothetical protein